MAFSGTSHMMVQKPSVACVSSTVPVRLLTPPVVATGKRTWAEGQQQFTNDVSGKFEQGEAAHRKTRAAPLEGLLDKVRLLDKVSSLRSLNYNKKKGFIMGIRLL